jgi:hypothetical protein
VVDFGISCVGKFPLNIAGAVLGAAVENVFGETGFSQGSWCLSLEIWRRKLRLIRVTLFPSQDWIKVGATDAAALVSFLKQARMKADEK